MDPAAEFPGAAFSSKLVEPGLLSARVGLGFAGQVPGHIGTVGLHLVGIERLQPERRTSEVFVEEGDGLVEIEHGCYFRSAAVHSERGISTALSPAGRSS